MPETSIDVMVSYAQTVQNLLGSVASPAPTPPRPAPTPSREHIGTLYLDEGLLYLGAPEFVFGPTAPYPINNMDSLRETVSLNGLNNRGHASPRGVGLTSGGVATVIGNSEMTGDARVYLVRNSDGVPTRVELELQMYPQIEDDDDYDYDEDDGGDFDD